MARNISKGRGNIETVDPATMTFEEYLRHVGYKALSFPEFDDWLKAIFDKNNNGVIDRGAESRKYNKATRNSGTVNEYLAEYQHAQAAAMAADNATVDNLRLLWQQGQLTAGKEVATRDALQKERDMMSNGKQDGKNNKILLMAVVAIAVIFLIK